MFSSIGLCLQAELQISQHPSFIHSFIQQREHYSEPIAGDRKENTAKRVLNLGP